MAPGPVELCPRTGVSLRRIQHLPCQFLMDGNYSPFFMILRSSDDSTAMGFEARFT
jgi:hypothetical protein